MNNKTLHLDSKFKPRRYQQKLWNAFHEGYKRMLYIGPRRLGKDVLGVNLCIAGALQRVGTYLYCLPTAESARAIIWNCIMSNGERMLDFIHPELIAKKNEQQMSITLINGSQIKLVGSDNYNNSIVGRNCAGMIWSEFALSDPLAWEYASPILAESGGFACFLSTVRGKNHLFDMYEAALDDPSWYVEKLTYDDTKHLSPEAWAQEVRSHSEDYIQQEYFCNFNLGIEGTIYGKYIDKLKLKGQIGKVPYQSRYRVNTAWDIGNDTTSIIFWQAVGSNIHIFDYHEDQNKNLEHYVHFIQEKAKENGWIFNKHFYPHDMQIKDYGALGPRYSRIFKVQHQLGLEGAIVVPQVKHEDGIELVRSEMSRMYIDEGRCKQLIKCLENYRYEFDTQKRVYTRLPVHNWASHGASALKYLSLGIPMASTETTPAELKARYERAMNRGSLNTIEDAFGRF